MPYRKLRRAGRDLLDVIGTPDSGATCTDCRDHLARVRIERRANRGGSAYSIKSHVMLHLCETCTTRFIERLLGMLGHMTRNRVDEELSFTAAEHAKIARDTGRAAAHDRHVRARIRRLAKDDDSLPAGGAAKLRDKLARRAA